MRLESRRVAIGDTFLAYHSVRRGAGASTVVFLHPWFGCWQFWRETIMRLPGMSCHALDLYSPGDGVTDEWKDWASPEGLAHAVYEMLSAEDVERAAIVGNSLGGVVAQTFAATWPDRIDALVLVGTGASTAGIKPKFKAEVNRWIRGDIPSGKGLRPHVEEVVGSLLARRPDSAATWFEYVDAIMKANHAYMGAVLDAAKTADLRSRLSDISARTLVVRGERDMVRTQRHVSDLLAGIRGSRSVELAGAGHSPMVDDVDHFVPLIFEFLREAAAHGASVAEVLA